MPRGSTPTIVVAGVSSSVGKTTVAIGLMHVLHKLGLRVQPFKVGPDFLDGMQHSAACGGIPSINLDGWMMGELGCLAAFHEAVASSAADIAIVEGCMGLHDGRDGLSDEGSTAQIAKWLGAPVLLVLDAWCLSRSAAAMVHGYKTFDQGVRLEGIIFNRVAGRSHGEWLRQAMTSAPSETAAVAVLGCLPSDQHLAVKERLLGLLPPSGTTSAAMTPNANARLAALHRIITEHVDLTALKALAATAGAPTTLSAGSATSPTPSLSPSLPPVRIAVARDAAFCFLYHDNLRLLEQAGATLVFFSPLADAEVPRGVGALYLCVRLAPRSHLPPPPLSLPSPLPPQPVPPPLSIAYASTPLPPRICHPPPSLNRASLSSQDWWLS